VPRASRPASRPARSTTIESSRPRAIHVATQPSEASRSVQPSTSRSTGMKRLPRFIVVTTIQSVAGPTPSFCSFNVELGAGGRSRFNG
jgi:hypothetical protein